MLDKSRIRPARRADKDFSRAGLRSRFHCGKNTIPFGDESKSCARLFAVAFAVRCGIITLQDAGWSSLVARQAHNLKAAGSNPAPATKFPLSSIAAVSDRR